MVEFKGPFFVLELTPRCNNNCIYCYNVWKKDKNYSQNELGTSSWKKIIKKLGSTKSNLISFSGGEPLLRNDIFELIAFAKKYFYQLNLITNGVLLNKEAVDKCIDAGATLFELPLLSHDKKIHNRLSGNNAWLKTLKAIKYIADKKHPVVGVIVLTKKNLDITKTIELGVALGINSYMLNRFNPGGEGIKHIKELLPTISQFKKVLRTADKLTAKYGISISSSIPNPPCLIDMKNYENIYTGFCPVGTDKAYYAVDPMGNVRPCNHSPVILGNLLKDSIEKIYNNPILKNYMQAIPDICKPCGLAEECQGGCKASAEVCFGSVYAEDPFLKQRTSVKNWKTL